MARQLLRAAGGRAADRQDRARRGHHVPDEIIEASDGIMVARGDLAVEVGNAGGAGAAKRMRARARANKLTITATQMMESMIHAPVPTRAGSFGRRERRARRHRRGDAVGGDRRGPLSGRDGRAMAQICVEAEKSDTVELDRDFLDRTFTRVDQSIAMATLFTAFHPKVKAIAVAYRFGLDGAVDVAAQRRLPDLRADAEVSPRSARWRCTGTCVRSALEQTGDRDHVLIAAEELLVARGQVRTAMIVLTIGEPMGKGGTVTMKIVRVGSIEVASAKRRTVRLVDEVGAALRVLRSMMSARKAGRPGAL